MWHGKRAEQEAINNTENRCIYSHAKSEGHDSNHGKSGTLRKRPKGEPDVSYKIAHGGLSKQTLATVAPHLGCLKAYGGNPLKVPQLAISGAPHHDAPCPLLGFKVSLTNMLRWMEKQVYLGTHFWRSECSQ